MYLKVLGSGEYKRTQAIVDAERKRKRKERRRRRKEKRLEKVFSVRYNGQGAMFAERKYHQDETRHVM